MTGRFTQADIIIPNPADSQAFDRYAYVLNNPVKYNDPSGLCTGRADDPDNPDKVCWDWIEKIQSEFSNIYIDPLNWLASQLEAVWQALVDHAFLPEILSAKSVTLHRRTFGGKGVGGATFSDPNQPGIYQIYIFDLAYTTLPQTGLANTPSLDNFRGVVAHELTHVAVNQRPDLKESYETNSVWIQNIFSELGTGYDWSRTTDPTAERIAIAAAVWEVDRSLFTTGPSWWIHWTNWSYSWIESFAYRDFCAVPVP